MDRRRTFDAEAVRPHRAPGSGKTSIALGLRRRGYAVVEEAVTDLIAAALAAGVDEPWLGVTFVDDVVALQRRRQLAPVPEGVAAQVFDRSPLCTLALARYLDLPVTPLLAAEVTLVVRDRVYEPTVFLVGPLGFIEPTAARRISYPDALRFASVHEAVYPGARIRTRRRGSRACRPTGRRGRTAPGRRPELTPIAVTSGPTRGAVRNQ